MIRWLLGLDQNPGPKRDFQNNEHNPKDRNDPKDSQIFYPPSAHQVSSDRDTSYNYNSLNTLNIAPLLYLIFFLKFFIH